MPSYDSQQVRVLASVLTALGCAIDPLTYVRVLTGAACCILVIAYTVYTDITLILSLVPTFQNALVLMFSI